MPRRPLTCPKSTCLLDARFGPARRKRTAYRLRDGMAALPALSFVARDGDALVGSVQCWPIALSTTAGAMLPLTLLGPLGDRCGRMKARASARR